MQVNPWLSTAESEIYFKIINFCNPISTIAVAARSMFVQKVISVLLFHPPRNTRLANKRATDQRRLKLKPIAEESCRVHLHIGLVMVQTRNGSSKTKVESLLPADN